MLVKKSKYDVAVVGATGLVGETMLDILKSRHFPVNNVFAVASERSAGNTVMFGTEKLLVQSIDQFDFNKADIAFFSAGGEVSSLYAPKAAEKGCVVIDNTSTFRYDDAIPLVIPEVNGEAISQYKNKNIIANPNCSTIQMLMALKPLDDYAQIVRINVATYQSVSGAGREGISELANQTGKLLNGLPVEPAAFSSQIAFNAIPHIDAFQDNGYTREEMKMVWETQKILGKPNICVNPTCVRIPVFYGHAEAIHVETEKKISKDQVIGLLKKMPGVVVTDIESTDKYPTQVSSASGTDEVFVGRIREDISCEKGINLWVVSDNVRKGAALNSIQIAERLIHDFLQC